MRVLVAGGSGFLGTVLVQALRQQGHQPTVLSREPRQAGERRWSPDSPDESLTAWVGESDAVINLAGASIGDRRWTASRKRAIHDSRVTATRTLAAAIAAAQRPPTVFLSGSAVGFYGSGEGSEQREEASPPGDDFLARVCVDWESSARAAESRCRVVLLRTGVVFDNVGGALPKMALPFRLGVGGPLGSGRQWVSWIYLQDWVAMVLWALERQSIVGPLNLTAPTPATNRDLSRALSNELRRPNLCRVPAFALRLLLGEMADALVLGGQRVVPRKAMDEGFTFRFGHLSPVLHALFG